VAKVHYELGIALQKCGQLEAALTAYRQAAELEPTLFFAWQNQGAILNILDRPEEAARAFSRATQLDTQSALSLQASAAWRRVCQWDRSRELEQSALEAIRTRQRHNAPVASFALLAVSDVTPADQLFFNRINAAYFIPTDKTRHTRPRSQPSSRIRVGYLSNDLRAHATAYLLAEVIERHDRDRFEILAYDYSPASDSVYRGRLEAAFDQWVNIDGLDYQAAAGRIAADALNIIVDLKGWTAATRSPILALQPAPVQVQWLGYPGTMGAPWVDYIIADPYLIRPGEESYYQEKVVRLPDTYQPNDRQRPIGDTPTRAACGLPGSGFVFCCFNQAYKITPEVFAIWMDLLKAVPGSVLWLLDDNRWATEALRGHASTHGVDPARLVFAQKAPLAEHLGRLQLADLALDCFPCGSHTTASDALWVGLPLLALSGETFASRVSGSLLTAIGLPDLISTNLEDYRAQALKLATDPASLAVVRQRLAQNQLTTPLFDSERFTRHLEQAYAQMWERHLAGLPADHIDVA
jgi:predicted O-linked N-acetylglucosamine transferase (SPINDLY family)